MQSRASDHETYQGGHRRVELGSQFANVGRILQATVDGEALAAIEVVLHHLLAVADKGRRRHGVLDELLHLARADASLLRKREDFRKELQRAEDEGVADELEGRRWETAFR